MFFLLRSAFWISVLLLVLPLGGSPKSAGPDAQDRAAIDAMSALAAAGATVSDLGGFCSRQPAACEVGQQALKLVGERAATAGSSIQDYLGRDAEPARPASVAAPASSRGTLSPTDRKPAWRGPAA